MNINFVSSSVAASLAVSKKIQNEEKARKVNPISSGKNQHLVSNIEGPFFDLSSNREMIKFYQVSPMQGKGFKIGEEAIFISIRRQGTQGNQGDKIKIQGRVLSYANGKFAVEVKA